MSALNQRIQKQEKMKPFELEEEISELEIPLMYVEQPSQSAQSRSSRNSKVQKKMPGSEQRMRSNPQTDEQSIRSSKHIHFIR